MQNCDTFAHLDHQIPHSRHAGCAIRASRPNLDTYDVTVGGLPLQSDTRGAPKCTAILRDCPKTLFGTPTLGTGAELLAVGPTSWPYVPSHGLGWPWVPSLGLRSQALALAPKRQPGTPILSLPEIPMQCAVEHSPKLLPSLEKSTHLTRRP